MMVEIDATIDATRIAVEGFFMETQSMFVRAMQSMQCLLSGTVEAATELH